MSWKWSRGAGEQAWCNDEIAIVLVRIRTLPFLDQTRTSRIVILSVAKDLLCFLLMFQRQ